MGVNIETIAPGNGEPMLKYLLFKGSSCLSAFIDVVFVGWL